MTPEDTTDGEAPAGRGPSGFAIVGIGCRFPGGEDPASFWDFLCAGGDGVVETPPARWRLERFYHPDPQVPGKTNVRRAGYLRQPLDEFDAGFFGFSPRQAAHLDPQQRLLFEVVWEAFEDAAIAPDALRGTDVGVYIGGFQTDHLIQVSDSANISLSGPHTASGATLGMLANQISHRFDFRGPSMTIDTACSSSLVTLSRALDDLAGRRCALAVVGGVGVLASPAVWVHLTKAGLLSPDGRCKAFDARADGYGRGEGAGAIILKPAPAATREGDRIRARVLSCAVTQNGWGDDITHPSSRAQARAMAATLADARADARDVALIEAHGTGTAAGDAAEFAALARTFGAGRRLDRRILVGSVKANIGHLEAAAGIAGVIKAALCLEHGLSPPHVGMREPNPRLDFAAAGLAVPTRRRRLPPRPGRRLACVNSSGYGGTNAHAVLAEAQHPGDGAAVAALGARNGPRVFPLSAADGAALHARAARLGETASRADPAGLAALLATGHSHLRHRLAIVASSAEGVSRALASHLAGAGSPRVLEGNSAPLTEGPVFVFTGMGPQRAGMGRQLYRHCAAFRAAVDEADACFQAVAGWSVRAAMLDPAGAAAMARNEVAQPANFLLQVGLAAALAARGVTPGAVIGHSVGEISAALVAGAVSLGDAVAIVAHRSRLLQRLAGKGGMLALRMSPCEAGRLVKDRFADADIAVVNAPQSVVVAGPLKTLDRLARHCERRAIRWRRLAVEVAYHSRQMAPLRQDFLAAVAGLGARREKLALWSTVLGRRHAALRRDAHYWWRNIAEPVRFADAINSLAASHPGPFIEIGPHPVVAGAIHEILAGRGTAPVTLASLRRDAHEARALEETIARLYVAGSPIDWRRRYPSRPQNLRLPAYPWQRRRHWPDGDAVADANTAVASHPVLGTAERHHPGAWQSDLATGELAYFSGHRVRGHAVVPGAAYISAALAAAREIAADGEVTRLGDVSFLSQLRLESHGEVALHSALDPETLRFDCAGRLGGRDPLAVFRAFIGAAAGAGAGEPRCRGEVRRGTPVDLAAHYEALAAAGLDYGESFRAVEQLEAGRDTVRATLSLAPALPVSPGETVHPALLDGAFQAALVLAPGRTLVPVAAEAVSLFRPLGRGALMSGEVTARAPFELTMNIALFDEADTPALELRQVRFRRPLDGAAAARAIALGALVHVDRWQEAPEGWAGSPVAAGGWAILARRDDALARALSVRLRGAAVGPDVRSGRLVCFLDALGAGADETGARTAARALKVLLGAARAARDGHPRIVLVTRGLAGADGAIDERALRQAPAIGILRTIATEIRGAEARWIDVPARIGQPIGDLAARLATAVLSAGPESEIAIGAGAVHVRRFGPAPFKIDTARGRRVAMQATASYRLVQTDPTTLSGLEFHQAPRRMPGPGEVALRVLLAPLMFKDRLKARLQLTGKATRGTATGDTLGAEAIASVVAVGEDVCELSPGRIIVCLLAGGTFANYVTTPVADLVWTDLPAGLSAIEAVTLPIPFATAVLALEHIAAVRPGESVLVHSAGGGLGLAAVQVARERGARVLATAGSEFRRRYLRSIGIEHIASSRDLDFARDVMEWTGGRGADVILNVLSGDALRASLGLVAPLGRFVELGRRDIDAGRGIAMTVFSRGATVSAVDLDRFAAERPDAFRDIIATVRDRAGTGTYRPLPATVFPASGVHEAFERLADDEHHGRVVVDMRGGRVPVRRTDVPLFARDGAFLVTGGFGGLGLATGRWLAENGAGTVVLAGRRVRRAGAAGKAIAAMRAAGSTVITIAVDIANAREVRALIRRFGGEWPPLRGVFHLAATMADAPIGAMGSRRIADVMRVKAGGALALHRATKAIDLDHFVLFSSISGMLGNASQANYNAANTFLDALAAMRHATSRPALSLALGPVGDVGMLRGRERAKDFLARRGLGPIGFEDVLAILPTVLGCGEAVVAVADLRWPALARAQRQLVDTARFSAIAALAADPAPRGGDGAAPPGGSREAARALVHREISAILRMDPADIRDDTPLGQMGMDSLMATELELALGQRCGFAFPRGEFLGNVSPRRIVELIVAPSRQA